MYMVKACIKNKGKAMAVSTKMALHHAKEKQALILKVFSSVKNCKNDKSMGYEEKNDEPGLRPASCHLVTRKC